MRGSLDLHLQWWNPSNGLHTLPAKFNRSTTVIAHEVMAALRNGDFMRVDDTTNQFKGEQTAQACAVA